jgi:basic membrane protein A and related proteins
MNKSLEQKMQLQKIIISVFLLRSIVCEQMSKFFYYLILLVSGNFIAFLPACATDVLKIGIVTVGSVSDHGYNYAHNTARLYLQSHLSNVQTSLAEKIPESAETERVMERMIAQGNKLIFSTSFGYLEPAERVAQRHPDVIIMQTWREAPQKNVGMFSAYQYEPLYAVGVVAGKMTKTNKVGFVYAHPVPHLLQDINAFALGMRSVNPKATVRMVCTNSWSDPPTEAEAAQGLIEQGVDILGCVLDSPLTIVRTAEKNHIMAFCSHADLHDIAPTQWLTGSHWHWDDLYLQIAKSVQKKTWKKEDYWLGMKDHAVELSSFGKLVPKSLQLEAQSVGEKIKDGKLVIFKGPLKDREGKLRLGTDQVADNNWLSQMNFVVSGVEGNLPK